MTKEQFLNDNTMTLLFDGGDTDYISTASGNTEKYTKWLERLSDFPEILETHS